MMPAAHSRIQPHERKRKKKKKFKAGREMVSWEKTIGIHVIQVPP